MHWHDKFHFTKSYDTQNASVSLVSILVEHIRIYIIIIIIIIIISSSSSSSIQPLGQFGQEPEPSQATGMALVRCILGKFLEVVCHYFPPMHIYIYIYIPNISFFVAMAAHANGFMN